MTTQEPSSEWLDEIFENLRYQVLNKKVEENKWQSEIWFEVTDKTKQAIQAEINKAVAVALEKHHPAKLTSGKKVGLYKILDRINKNMAGHTKKLRVQCIKCGEIMFRTNNRLKTEHRYCPKRLTQLEADLNKVEDTE